MQPLMLMRGLGRTAAFIGTSLKLKFILIVIVMLASTIGLAPWTAIMMHERHLLDASGQRLSAVWKMVDESIVTTCVLTGDREALQKLFEAMRGYHNIDLARLFLPDGHIIYSSFPLDRDVSHSEVERYSGHPEPLILTDSAGVSTHTLARPIFVEPNCVSCHGAQDRLLGILQVSIPLRETFDQLGALRRWAWLATLVTLVVITIGIWGSLTVLVDRPLQQLLTTIAQAAGGDLHTRTKLRRADELGRLGERLNDMIMRLESAQNEVARYHGQQLARADRLATIGQMAAALAHEIRNPLTAIKGVLSVLSRDLPENDSRMNFVQKTLELIDRLDKSVENVLQYSRPSPSQFKAVSLRNVIDSTLAFARGQAKKARVQIEHAACGDPACSDAPSSVTADAHQLQQVLMNLVLNAIQATPAQGTIWIRTCTTVDPDGRRFACILVEDNGKGMAPEELGQAFDPFFSTKANGTGLGLPIAKQLIEQHGGRVSVESEAGRGTCVRVEIPLDPQTTSGEKA